MDSEPRCFQAFRSVLKSAFSPSHPRLQPRPVDVGQRRPSYRFLRGCNSAALAPQLRVIRETPGFRRKTRWGCWRHGSRRDRRRGSAYGHRGENETRSFCPGASRTLRVRRDSQTWCGLALIVASCRNEADAMKLSRALADEEPSSDDDDSPTLSNGSG